MTIEPIGDIADVSLTDNTPSSDPSQAQMLARVGHPTERISRESGVTESISQMNTRRQTKRT